MQGNVVAITGASAGIGRATAIAFAQRGWRVALLSRSSEGLEGARSDVERAGGTALVLPTDVADHRQVEAAAQRIEEAWGEIDVWVNNAMATIFCDFLHIAPEDFRRATEVTYLGSVYGTLAALKRMRARNRGVIVQVGSALAYRSIPLQSPYCGAKSALRGFTDALRSELIHDRSDVQITMVHLSAFNTPQFDWGRTCMTHQPRPVGKIFAPEVAAKAIYHAAVHPRREVWVGLPAVQAIMAQRFFPGVLDRLLARTAYEGQHTAERLSPDRKDNLYAPVAGDHGTNGRFRGVAVRWSAQSWANTHRWLIAGGLALVYFATRRNRAHR